MTDANSFREELYNFMAACNEAIEYAIDEAIANGIPLIAMRIEEYTTWSDKEGGFAYQCKIVDKRKETH